MAKIHGKHTRVYIDGYDLSGDFNSFEPGFAADVAEISGFGDDTKKYVVGLNDPAIRIGALFNDAANQAHEVMQARQGSNVMLDAIWGTAQLQPGVGGSLSLSEYSVNSPISGAVAAQASLAGASDNAGAFEYIKTVHPNGTVQGTASAVGFDFGTTFENGMIGHLQHFTGNGRVRIQSSTAQAGPNWTERLDFTNSTAPVGRRATHAPFSGERFLRVGISSGTVFAWVGVKRL